MPEKIIAMCVALIPNFRWVWVWEKAASGGWFRTTSNFLYRHNAVRCEIKINRSDAYIFNTGSHIVNFSSV